MRTVVGKDGEDFHKAGRLYPHERCATDGLKRVLTFL
jgi:hypothetical protein